MQACRGDSGVCSVGDCSSGQQQLHYTSAAATVCSQMAEHDHCYLPSIGKHVANVEAACRDCDLTSDRQP